MGTSGWVYKSWAGSFYPADVSGTEQLDYYASVFCSVEINASFYKLQLPEAVTSWKLRSPRGFRFAMKGSRFITHMKKLRVEPKSIDVFFERARLLGAKCGPILWQLPPNLHVDLERLDAFLAALPKRFRYAVEFRHASWYEDAGSADVLRRHRAAFVWLSTLALPPVKPRTTDFVYLRFHGLEGGYAHDYTARELRPWVEACRRVLEDGDEVYAYFNNDGNTRAPQNALAFRASITREARRRAA